MSISYYHTQLQKIKNSDNKDLLKIHYKEHDVFLKLIDESEETITLLTKWRKQYRNNFGSDFTIDENRTKKWIKEQVLSNIDKIVFLIYVDNQKIGIISTSEYDEDTNSAILDTMMKDPKFELPGLMTTIEKVYLKWMFDGLKLEKIRGVLFSDNLLISLIRKGVNSFPLIELILALLIESLIHFCINFLSIDLFLGIGLNINTELFRSI